MAIPYMDKGTGDRTSTADVTVLNGCRDCI